MKIILGGFLLFSGILGATPVQKKKPQKTIQLKSQQTKTVSSSHKKSQTTQKKISQSSLKKATAPAPVYLVTPTNYGKISSAKEPVLLDVYAEWCAPCLNMAPLFGQAAQQFVGKIRFAKIMIASFEDSDPTVQFLQKTYKTTLDCVPTLLFIKDGKVIQKLEGVMSLDALTQSLNTLLKSV